MDKKKMKLVAIGLITSFGLSSCATTYDSYGRPVTTVDPVAATIGAIAIGAVAYSAGKNDRYRKCNRHKGYYSHRYYGGNYAYRPCYR